MAHRCKYTKRAEETFDFVSNSNQHVCKGRKVNHRLRLVPETVTNGNDLLLIFLTSTTQNEITHFRAVILTPPVVKSEIAYTTNFVVPGKTASDRNVSFSEIYSVFCARSLQIRLTSSLLEMTVNLTWKE